MQIRAAAHSDAPLIIAFDEVARTSRDRVNFIYSVISARHCYVAADKQQVVAYGVLEHNFFQQGFVSMLYVSSPHRRSGIGSALMTHMESQCKTPKLFTSTEETNTAMRALLAKLKYEPSGAIEGLNDTGPELIFAKQLRTTV